MSTENKSTEIKSIEHKSTEHVTKAELRAEAALARAQLASTLDAIEYKLNVPKQIKITIRRIVHGLHRLGDDNPTALVGVALGAAAAAGVAVWLGVQAVLKR